MSYNLIHCNCGCTYAEADGHNCIEELKETLRLRTTERNYANDVVNTYVEQVKELEANLAKAMEALRNVVVEYNLFRKDEYERGLSPLDDEIYDARTTLAELKGENQ